VILDHELRLTPEALDGIVAVLHQQGPDWRGLVYGDEMVEGARWWKSAWSPERLLGQDYLTGVTCFSRRLATELLTGATWPARYEMALWAVERGATGQRVPHVLAERAHLDQVDHQARLVQEHLARAGRTASIETHPDGRLLRAAEEIDAPVSVIIPTAGRRRDGCRVDEPLVVHCVRRVLGERGARAQPFEMLVVVDEQVPSDVLAWLADRHADGVRIVHAEGPFNFSRRVNLAAVQARGQVFVLLNDDVEVTGRDWVDQIVAPVLLPGVAMAGPMLRFDDGRIQSAGHTHSQGEPWSTGRLLPGDSPGPHGLFRVAREVSGVTAACAAVRRDVFFEVGGMSEDFPVDFGDVDLCLKLLTEGWRIIWTPAVSFVHFERSSRAPTALPGAIDALRRRWGDELWHDAFDPDGPHVLRD
jgi:GT2 family glycosyltransferase